MAKALKCEYELDIPEFSLVSSEARDLVERLLVAEPEERLTAEDCLAHPWLSGQASLTMAGWQHLIPSPSLVQNRIELIICRLKFNNPCHPIIYAFGDK